MIAKQKLRKKARVKKQPSNKKSVRLEKKPDSFNKCHPVWEWDLMDIDGPWSWEKLSVKEFCWNILPKLKSFETMSWENINNTEKNNSHNVSLDKITSGARRRLKEIKIEDIDELYSLRLDGKSRIWGIRKGSVLKIIWWDPHHQICPSSKKGS